MKIELFVCIMTFVIIRFTGNIFLATAWLFFWLGYAVATFVNPTVY